jgi:hypothetical protein
VDSDIHLSFLYFQQDIVRAMRAHYASRLRLKLDISVAVAAAVLGAYLWQSSSAPYYGMALVGLAVILVFILVVAFGVIPGLVFRREAKFRDEYSLTFSSEGIHFHTVHIDSQLEWSLYTRALIDIHSIVLYYGSRSFTVIPKRVFESSEQQAAFERLISQKIPNVSRKGP